MTASAAPRVSTGVTGLDDVLHGGLTRDRLYLMEGMPGSGKTTLAFQFLLDGAKHGEPVLYLTLSETEEEIRAVAASHGWSLDGVAILEVMPSQALGLDDQYTVFHPSEVELSDTTRKVLEAVDRQRPTRIAVDSLSELRLLANSALRYRRQILALKQFFSGRRCTVLLLDDLTSVDRDLQVQSIVHGAMLLEHTVPAFGAARRRLRITKFRGSDFRGGYHDYVIHRGGIEVFPRLVAAEHRQPVTRERMTSGVREIDMLLGGGLERGTSTLLQGAAGTGKSTVATLFAVTATERGQDVAMFIFDESSNTLLSRMSGLGYDLERHIASGRLTLDEVDPAELSPGQFAHAIRKAVEERNAAIVVIDSLNGYLNSMPDENFLIAQLHELLSYLGQKGVATILVAAHQGMMSAQMTGPVDASYLADSVVLIRYFEIDGEVRQAISVVKMRGSNHERTIREFRLRDGRIHVGEPLRGFRGVLSGVPERLPEA
ncbi:MAG TPA: ATPase domain-containing protein [Casimicrobiaceae bacterium]|nr:ATPase domain-containing protein [Casimicrobiaceae bacterium]